MHKNLFKFNNKDTRTTATNIVAVSLFLILKKDLPVLIYLTYSSNIWCFYGWVIIHQLFEIVCLSRTCVSSEYNWLTFIGSHHGTICCLRNSIYMRRHVFLLTTLEHFNDLSREESSWLQKSSDWIILIMFISVHDRNYLLSVLTEKKDKTWHSII